MRNNIKLGLTLVRAGSNIFLFFADIALFITLLYDANNLSRYTDSSLFTLFKESVENLSLRGLLIASAYLLLLPVAVSFASFVFPKIHAHRQTSYAARNYFFMIHTFTAIVLCLAVSNMENYNQLAGYNLQRDSKGNLYLKDNFESIIIYLTIYIPTILTFLFSIIKVLSLTSSSNKEEKKITLRRSWSLFLGLADATSEYMPNQNIRKWIIYFNCASMSPDINWILQKSTTLRSEYQKKIPTSEEARNFLKEKSKECKELLLDYLIEQKYSLNHHVEFYSGTSRALEVILSKYDNLENIIISPLEHFSQADVIKWFKKKHTTLNVVPIPFSENYVQHDKQQNFNESLLITELDKRIQELKQAKGNAQVTILLSEVNYKTGYKVNVNEVIVSLRSKYENLSFIIDGSQSVGNIEKPFSPFEPVMGNEDYYYFSVHKWLLSPNTCGVVINKNPYDISKRSYDVFDLDIPTSTIDPNTIFGLRASLAFIFSEMTFEEIRKRSKLLRDYFEQTMPEGFQIIGDSKRIESNFIAIRPKDTYQWKSKLASKEGILNFFKMYSLDATILEIDVIQSEKKNWIRLSFPYFIEQFQIERLNRILSICIENIDA